MKKKIRLQDIAKRVNLSVSAVSLALRNHPSISAESKKRVQDVCNELGYRAPGSRSGGAPASRNTLNLAYCLVGESLQDEAYTPIADGIIHACRHWKANLAIHQLAEKPSPSQRVTMPTGEEPDGYLLVGFLNTEIVNTCTGSGKPTIIIGRNRLEEKYSTVVADIVRAGNLVAKRAIDDGYKTFVHIAANLDSLHNIEFLKGVRETLGTHGLQLPDNQVLIASDYTLHEPAFLDQLSRLAKEPTALLIPGSVTATACASVLHTKGWMARKKFGIYALRQSDSGEINPFYKSLNLGFERLGHIAVDRLIQKILGYETYSGVSSTQISPAEWLDAKEQPI